MASDIKWRSGFGWGTVTAVVLPGTLALASTGFLRWLATVAALFAGVFAIYQYRKWNTDGWPKIHYRAMLLFASLAGTESRRAEAGGRPFDQRAPCRELGLKICGAGREANVDAMIDELQREKGAYFVSLLEKHESDLFPKANTESMRAVLSGVGKVEFGPSLVICNIVENSFGSLEAAKYVLALLQGHAH
ncbi:MAG: hypothetical protein IH884_07580 [Myxococcales bacterium]|nr:hypothetical protein [Myxococcales bacterium]